MGQIRKRGGRWWIRYYRNGRRHEESAGKRSYDEARALLNEREGDIAKGVPVSAKNARLRIADALDAVIVNYEVNGKRSVAHVTRHAARLKAFFGHTRASDVTGSDVDRYVAERQKAGAKNATINRELAALRRAFTLAIKNGKLTVKPTITMLKENNVRTGFFEKEQFAAVLAHLPAPLQALATLAYWSGWRRSEVLKLEWSRVDRKAQIIRLDVGTTKNKKGREFHYAGIADVVEMIDRQWAAHEALKKQATPVLCRLVFHRDGKPIKRFEGAWASACAAAGCPGRLLHDLRRTAVRNLVRQGVSEKVAMQVTGHKSRSVFDRYDIVDGADLADAGRKLGAMGTISGTISRSDDAPATTKASA